MVNPFLQQYLSILLNNYSEEQLRNKVVKLIDSHLYCAISSDIDGDFSCHDKEWDLNYSRFLWIHDSLEKAIKSFCPPANYMNIVISKELENELKNYYQ
jgi:hypothetical protein